MKVRLRRRKVTAYLRPGLLGDLDRLTAELEHADGFKVSRSEAIEAAVSLALANPDDLEAELRSMR